MRSDLLLLVVSCVISLSFLPVVSSRGECLPVNDDKETFHCFNTKKPHKECENFNDECDGWARRGECHKNPAFMIKNCRKVCGLCMDLHVGEIQFAPDASTRRAVLDRLMDTRDYVYTATERNPQIFRKCKNEHEMCTYWAVLGECDTNAGFMDVSCSAACKKCH